MNTTVVVEGAAVDVQWWFRHVENTLSRFDPDSSLSRLNRLTGRWVLVPPLLYQAVKRSLKAAAATGGAFDPTVLDALEASGYSHSFDRGPTPPTAPVPAGRWAEVELEPRLKAVRLPPGVRLDLGGIGKGLAVDGAIARMRHLPFALVNAGGDLACRTTPGEGPVLVEVEDPFHPGNTLIRFALENGAAATSSTLGRRWERGLHHIIDPATGRPTDSGIVAATVFADTAVQAEVLAKACIVLGREQGLELFRERGCYGVLVTEQGHPILTPGIEEFVYAEK